MSIFMLILLAAIAFGIVSAFTPKRSTTMTPERWEQLNPGQTYPLNN